MHYPDLTQCEWFQAKVPILMVGWLQSGRDFTRGDLSNEVFRKLVTLLKRPWDPHPSGGLHRCEFSRFSGGPFSVTFEDDTAPIGTANLFIPTGQHVFLAPSTILHYIDAHGYSPPAEFQEAVLSCPEMRSVAYFKKIKAAGLLNVQPEA